MRNAAELMEEMRTRAGGRPHLRRLMNASTQALQGYEDDGVIPGGRYLSRLMLMFPDLAEELLAVYATPPADELQGSKGRDRVPFEFDVHDPPMPLTTENFAAAVWIRGMAERGEVEATPEERAALNRTVHGGHDIHAGDHRLIVDLIARVLSGPGEAADVDPAATVEAAMREGERLAGEVADPATKPSGQGGRRARGRSR